MTLNVSIADTKLINVQDAEVIEDQNIIVNVPQGILMMDLTKTASYARPNVWSVSQSIYAQGALLTESEPHALARDKLQSKLPVNGVYRVMWHFHR